MNDKFRIAISGLYFDYENDGAVQFYKRDDWASPITSVLGTYGVQIYLIL